MNSGEQDVLGIRERTEVRLIGALSVLVLVAFAVWLSSTGSMRVPITTKSLVTGTAWLVVPPCLLVVLSFTPFDFFLASFAAANGLLSVVLFPCLSFVLWLSTGHYVVLISLALVGALYLAPGYRFYRNSSGRIVFITCTVALAVVLGFYFSHGVSLLNHDAVLFATK